LIFQDMQAASLLCSCRCETPSEWHEDHARASES
jgi:hypothetical protein